MPMADALGDAQAGQPFLGLHNAYHLETHEELWPTLFVYEYGGGKRQNKC